MRIFASCALAILLFGCGKSDDIEPQVNFTPIAYEKLKGWQSDNPIAAVVAFRRSCEKLLRRPGPSPIGAHDVYGTADDWRLACDAAEKFSDTSSPDDARRFFEAWFQPFAVTADDETEGLITGYYEPLLHGSKSKAGAFAVPLYLPPEDLVKVDLGKFDPDLSGRSIRGRIEGQEFIPYFSRDDITGGALANVTNLTAVTSCGSSRLVNLVQGEWGKRYLKTAVRGRCATNADFNWIALYKIDRRTMAETTEHLDVVARRFGS